MREYPFINLYPLRESKDGIKKELIYEGKAGTYTWYIMSWAECPLVYMAIPKKHKYYGKDYRDIPIKVHGGLTFKGEVFDNQCIGWDYGHAGDRFDSPIIGCTLRKGKEWTFEEIQEEVNSVANQLTKLDFGGIK